jgi:hypothetical protein
MNLEKLPFIDETLRLNIDMLRFLNNIVSDCAGDLNCYADEYRSTIQSFEEKHEKLWDSIHKLSNGEHSDRSQTVEVSDE